ncbi:MAG TPA: hypothetical protein VJ455_12570 [Ignavibacteria bacterium]|nr:hypothetical protein [Ignavibacteria bacterium]
MKLLYIFVLIIFISISVFSQTNTLKFDLKYEITTNDFITVNDTADHKIGRATGLGSVIFSDGTQGLVKVYFIYDYIKGNGDFTEYYDITLIGDTSKLTVQAKGESIGSSNGYAPLFTGTVTISGGSGKFEGLYGEGSCSGNRNESLITGAVVKMSFTISAHY